MGAVSSLHVKAGVAYLQQNPGGLPALRQQGASPAIIELLSRIDRCFDLGRPDLLRAMQVGTEDLTKWCFEHGQTLVDFEDSGDFGSVIRGMVRIGGDVLRDQCSALVTRPAPETPTPYQVLYAAGSGDKSLFEQSYLSTPEVRQNPDGEQAHTLAVASALIAAGMGANEVVDSAIRLGALWSPDATRDLLIALVSKGHVDQAERILSRPEVESLTLFQMSSVLGSAIYFYQNGFAERMLQRRDIHWDQNSLMGALSVAQCMGNELMTQILLKRPEWPWNAEGYLDKMEDAFFESEVLTAAFYGQTAFVEGYFAGKTDQVTQEELMDLLGVSIFQGHQELTQMLLKRPEWPWNADEYHQTLEDGFGVK